MLFKAESIRPPGGVNYDSIVLSNAAGDPLGRHASMLELCESYEWASLLDTRLYSIYAFGEVMLYKSSSSINDSAFSDEAYRTLHVSNRAYQIACKSSLFGRPVWVGFVEFTTNPIRSTECDY